MAVLAAVACGCRADGTSGERWWRGNLHTHTLWSDGNDFPDMVADWYVRNGYHFLALSDHNILSVGEKWVDAELPRKRGAKRPLARYRERFGEDWVETREKDGKTEVRLKTLDELRRRFEAPGRFLMIQAEEITDSAHGRLPVHINATNLAELIEPQRGASVRDVIRRNLRAIAEQERRLGRPILGHLNHPNFGWAVTAEDLAAVTEEQFFEVFNGHRGTHHLGDAEHASVERIWDIACTLRIANGAPPLFGIATDDSHHYHGANPTSTPGRGWIMVRAPALSPEALIAALRQGAFYASSGVGLRDVRLEGRELVVEVDAVAGAEYEIRFIGTVAGYDTRSAGVRDESGNPLRTTRRYSDDIGKLLATVSGPIGRYRLTGKELYVRAVITSSTAHPDPTFPGQKLQAWTQPVGWR